MYNDERPLYKCIYVRRSTYIVYHRNINVAPPACVLQY